MNWDHLTDWLESLACRLGHCGTGFSKGSSPRLRPWLEVLENRILLTTITDLGTVSDIFGGAEGINDAGQVVGLTATASGSPFAFLYSNGQVTNLGTLPGGGPPSNIDNAIPACVATGINDSGQMVGYSTSANDSGYKAFLYSNGQMTDLGTLTGGGESWAYGINDSGQVAGESYTSSNSQYHAFLYSNGNMTDLGTLPGGSFSQAYGINDAGRVVGYSNTGGSGGYHAFLYSNGKMTDLGTLPGLADAGSQANGINDAGVVVGESLTFNTLGGSSDHAFLYSNGQMTDLGTLPGYLSSDANGINDTGQVVGVSYSYNSPVSHAFLYSNGQMIDLNTLLPPNSGWVLYSATAINDSGQIVGDGVYNGAPDHEFLLTLNSNSINEGSVEIHLSSPSQVPAGVPGEVTIDYTNTGATTATAPLLTLSTSKGNATFNLPGQPNEGTTINILAGDPNGASFLDLPPGFTNTITVQYTPTTSAPLQFTLNQLSDPNEPFNWQGLAADVPSGDTASDWESLVQAAQGAIGNTWGHVLAAMSDVSNTSGVASNGIPEANSVYDFDSFFPFLSLVDGANALGESTDFTDSPGIGSPADNSLPSKFTLLSGQNDGYGEVDLYYLGTLTNPSHIYVVFPGKGGVDESNDAMVSAAETIYNTDPNSLVILMDAANMSGSPESVLIPNGNTIASMLNSATADKTITGYSSQDVTFIAHSDGNIVADQTAYVLGGIGTMFVVNPPNNDGTYLGLSAQNPNYTVSASTVLVFDSNSLWDQHNVEGDYDIHVTIGGGQTAQHDGVMDLLMQPANGETLPILVDPSQVELSHNGTLDPNRNYTPLPSAAPPPPQPPVLYDAPPLFQTVVMDSSSIQVSNPSDTISTPTGDGSDDLVSDDEDLSSDIYFSNDASSTVTITDQLDPNLDFSSLALANITLLSGTGNPISLWVPPGDDSYSTTVDATSTLGSYIDVNTTFSDTTGELNVDINQSDTSAASSVNSFGSSAAVLNSQAVRTLTPLASTPPLIEGSIYFTVRPKASDATGTAIHSQATIVAGQSTPVDTPIVSNTVNSSRPTSSVNPLPATETTTSFTIRWSGQDDAGGTGIAFYDIYVSDNGGAFTPLLTGSMQPSTIFTGQDGHSYSFYSVATDNVGNRQTTPTAAQASTVVSLPPAPLPPPPPTSPSSPPTLSSSAAPPTLQEPPLLALLDAILGGIETVNSDGSVTVTDSLFGIPLFVSTFDSSGRLEDVMLLGIDITFLFG